MPRYIDSKDLYGFFVINNSGECFIDCSNGFNYLMINNNDGGVQVHVVRYGIWERMNEGGGIYKVLGCHNMLAVTGVRFIRLID